MYGPVHRELVQLHGAFLSDELIVAGVGLGEGKHALRGASRPLGRGSAPYSSILPWKTQGG